MSIYNSRQRNPTHSAYPTTHTSEELGSSGRTNPPRPCEAATSRATRLPLSWPNLRPNRTHQTSNLSQSTCRTGYPCLGRPTPRSYVPCICQPSEQGSFHQIQSPTHSCPGIHTLTITNQTHFTGTDARPWVDGCICFCFVFARARQPPLLICTQYAERSRLHPRPPLHAPFYLRLTSASSLPTQTREMGGLHAEGHAYAHPIWQAWQSVWGGETQGGREVATTTTHKLHLVAQT